MIAFTVGAWVGLGIVVFSGINIGLAAVLAFKDISDVFKGPGHVLGLYGIGRLGMICLMWPILKLLVRMRTFEQVTVSFDSIMFLLGLFFLFVSLSGIWYFYPMIRRAAIQMTLLELQRRDNKQSKKAGNGDVHAG